MRTDQSPPGLAGVGPVAEATWAQLAELDAGAWFHSRFSGTRIPRLEPAISDWRQLGLQAFIELKVNPGQDPEHEAGQLLVGGLSGPVR